MSRASITRANAISQTGRIADLTETSINQIFGVIDRRPIATQIIAEPIGHDPITDQAMIDPAMVHSSAPPFEAGPTSAAIQRITPSRIIFAIPAIIDAWRRGIFALIFGARTIRSVG